MTASNSRSGFPMVSKFPKALMAAGLAAVLVGCGGGSSTTPVANDDMGDDMPPPTDSTAAEEAAKKIQASHDTVKGLVDGLTVDSDAEQIKSVRDQANALLTDIRTTTDLEDRSGFTTKANELLAAIAKVEADQKAAADELASETMRMNQRNAWKTALSTHSLDTIGTAWPTAAIGSRTGSTVGGLSDGWTGRNYEYPLSGLEEQGKTFRKTVTKMTPGITLRWDELAVEAAKTNRSSVIDDFLGGSGIRFEALESGAVADSNGTIEASTDLKLVSTLAGTDLTGSGVVYQIRTGLNLAAPTTAFTAGAAVFTENSGSHVITTSFHKSDFMKVDANFLANVPAALNAEIWDIDATFTDFLQASANPKYVMWKGIPVHVTFTDDSASTGAISARFNPTTGFLEYVPVATGPIAVNERFAVSFRPVDPNSLGNIATQNIHSKFLDVREESTKTNAVTEFAYWASERTANPFTVTVKTFARGMNFDDVTDMPEELTGSATYNGLAAGYYAMGTESNGEFTADAMLTADFGTNTVTGMIDSFMPMTGSDDLSSWNLALSAATFMDDTFGDAFSGGTQGGGGEGEWNGQFLGMANPGNSLTLDMTDDYPEAVVGNFRGHFANDGHVVGAFGANLEE